MANAFWGWPDNYERDVNPRKDKIEGEGEGEDRVYWNWRPEWRISSTIGKEPPVEQPVRMYFYENSRDFRFYAGAIVRLDARGGDIIRIRRVDEDDVTFECALAPTGSPEHAQWGHYLVNTVHSGRSSRRFGYA